MKNIIKSIIFILLISLILPNLVFASWWNPVSWLKTEKVLQNNVFISTSTDSNIITKNDSDSEVINLKKQISDLLKQIEILKDSKLEVKEIIKEIPVEKIIYQDKIIEKIVYRDNYIPCQQDIISQPNIYEDKFSDFIFEYTYDREAGSLKMTSNTSRDLILKKAVFKIPIEYINETFTNQRMILNSTRYYYYYSLERSSNGIFSYVGNGDIKIKYGNQIIIDIDTPEHKISKKDVDFVLSDWIIWDNTTNKQVRIQ